MVLFPTLAVDFLIQRIGLPVTLWQDNYKTHGCNSTQIMTGEYDHVGKAIYMEILTRLF